MSIVTKGDNLPKATIDMTLNSEAMRRAIEFYLSQEVLKEPCTVTQVMQLRDHDKTGQFSIIFKVGRKEVEPGDFSGVQGVEGTAGE
jgi:hypothetical protein